MIYFRPKKPQRSNYVADTGSKNVNNKLCGKGLVGWVVSNSVVMLGGRGDVV